MARVKLSAPWDEFYNEVNELFRYDDEVRVVFFEEQKTIKLYVDNPAKAEALQKLLPQKKEWGKVVLLIEVIPSNKEKKTELTRSIWSVAFTSNTAVSFIYTIDGIFSNPLTYVVFVNEVVQYFNDNLGDINGNRSTLYEDIARDVFENVDATFFCTDTPEGLENPKFERVL